MATKTERLRKFEYVMRELAAQARRLEDLERDMLEIAEHLSEEDA